MNVFDLLYDAPTLHAISAHFPLALSVLGVLMVFAGIVTKMQRPYMRWLAFALYCLLGMGAFLAVVTGEGASGALPAQLPPDLVKTLDMHQWLAEYLWLFASGTALCLVFCAVRMEWFRATFAMFALILSLVTAGWAGVTTAYGMNMVYKYGAGTAVFAAAPVPGPAGLAAPPPASPVAAEAEGSGQPPMPPTALAPMGTGPGNPAGMLFPPMRKPGLQPKALLQPKESYTHRVSGFLKRMTDAVLGP